MTNNEKKIILLSGGGTAGSVVPLLGIADAIKKEKNNFDKIEFAWIGTRDGIEKKMIKTEKIKYYGIFGGKLRRYFSWKNFVDPLLIFFGFLQAFKIIISLRPSLILTAGSFISVPVVLAGWVLRVPIFIHQQDVRPGLANKIMSPFAKIITVTFEKSKKDYGDKAIVVGNILRSEIKHMKLRKEWAMEKLGLRNDLPVVLVMGGGTGAKEINKITEELLEEITKFCQVIHITGKDKSQIGELISSNDLGQKSTVVNYRPYEFCNIEGMLKNYRVADVVVSRCGMSALTELSFLGKPSILIPMPNSHQEENVLPFKEKKAAIVLEQKNLTSKVLLDSIKQLIVDKKSREEYARNIKDIIRGDADKEYLKLLGDFLK